MKKVVYGYARVSSNDQNLERQLKALMEFGVPERNILCDKASGKDFNRKEYNLLVGTETSAHLLREGDLLVIASLDRLGRDYLEIREQWNYILNSIGADIKVLDMPLLDTRETDGSLDKRFVADLVLQILSYVAEKERENIKKRQRQGIDVMPVIDGKKVSLKTGRPTGRPPAKYPNEWDKYYQNWKDGTITAKRCIEEMQLKRATFYKLVSRYEADNR